MLMLFSLACAVLFTVQSGPDAPWLVLRRYDLGWYDPHTQSFSLIASILDAEGGGAAAEARLRNVRLNEAHTDPLGRLWIATKLEPDVEKPIATEEEMEQGKGERPVGAVYLFDPRTGKLEVRPSRAKLVLQTIVVRARLTPLLLSTPPAHRKSSTAYTSQTRSPSRATGNTFTSETRPCRPSGLVPFPHVCA